MASNPQHEPTMEEILASIRKIISEDSTEAQPAAAPAVEAKPASVADVKAAPIEADVLELTHEVVEEPAPKPAPEPVAMAPQHRVEDDLVFETIQEAPVSHEAPASPTSHEGFFSDKTRKALEDSFASIEPDRDTPAARAAAPMMPVDGRTVEAVFERAVRESFDPLLHEWLGSNADAIVDRMKPIIREWMDEHFPALLEGAVRDEVARVARGRR